MSSECLVFTVARGIHEVAVSADSVQWADVAIMHLLLFTDCNIQQKSSKAHYVHPTLPFPDAHTGPIA